jgi:hypothetical protein
VVQEEIEVKWGELLGVVALTTNQPYFFTVVATGERGHAWLLRVASAVPVVQPPPWFVPFCDVTRMFWWMPVAADLS